ncbi:hypothetical protein HB777_13275 [Mesorhizobium loti]|nr:hypothetical protein HB777_13275 [Mesorhizobium loti]
MPENIRSTSRDVPLIQLGLYQCRFPVSEDPSVPGGYRFCAGSTSPDRVYCDHHHSIVTAVDPRRTRSGLPPLNDAPRKLSGRRPREQVAMAQRDAPHISWGHRRGNDMTRAHMKTP